MGYFPLHFFSSPKIACIFAIFIIDHIFSPSSDFQELFLIPAHYLVTAVGFFAPPPLHHHPLLFNTCFISYTVHINFQINLS